MANSDKASVSNYDTILYPVVTEKSQTASSFNKFTFVVRPSATKQSIKSAISNIFDVKVASVSTINRKGKTKVFKGVNGKRKGLKIAIVTLADGQSLDLGLGN
jgi:large subunit ribosomal protein L23